MIFSNNKIKKYIISFIFMLPLSQQTLISADILLSHIAHITHFSPRFIYMHHPIFHTLHCYGPWPPLKCSTLNPTIIPLLSRTHLHLLSPLTSDHNIICKHHNSCRSLSNVTNAEHVLYVLEIKSYLPDRWRGHVRGSRGEYVGTKMLRLDLQGRKPRENTKRRFMDTVKEHIKSLDERECLCLPGSRWLYYIYVEKCISTERHIQEEVALEVVTQWLTGKYWGVYQILLTLYSVGPLGF